MNKIDYNKLTNEQLKDIFSDVKFALPPFRHQYLTLAQTIGNSLLRVCYFHDIGVGKTLSALWTTQLWETKKILVVCPYSAFPAWDKNIRKYTNYLHTFLVGSSDERKYKLYKRKNIYIINYEGLKTIYANLISGKDKEGNIIKSWKINYKAFIDNFDCVIFDEVHKCKAFSSLQSKICFQLSHRAKFAIGLTGTPIGSSFLDLWGEMKVIDLGQSLGTNYYAFRRTYFNEGKFDWYIKKGMDEKILEKIAPITTSFSRSECLDLPNKIYETRVVEATDEQKKLEEDIVKGLNIQYAEGKLNLKNVLNLSQKLLQISGGFLYLKDAVKLIQPNPKLEVVGDIISETHRKVIIFHQFVEEGRILEKWCRKNKIKYASLRGEIKDKQSEYYKFINKPDIKVMIAHPISGGESLDDFPKVCSVIVFYSNSGIFSQREQAEGRIWREPQKQKSVFIDIKLEDSIDEIMCKRYKSRKKLSEKLLKYIREK